MRAVVELGGGGPLPSRPSREEQEDDRDKSISSEGVSSLGRAGAGPGGKKKGKEGSRPPGKKGRRPGRSAARLARVRVGFPYLFLSYFKTVLETFVKSKWNKTSFSLEYENI